MLQNNFPNANFRWGEYHSTLFLFSFQQYVYFNISVSNNYLCIKRTIILCRLTNAKVRNSNVFCNSPHSLLSNFDEHLSNQPKYSSHRISNSLYHFVPNLRINGSFKYLYNGTPTSLPNFVAQSQISHSW